MDFDNLHQILRVLYDQMMPLCSNMAGVAKGVAGLGALFYVAIRVWQSLSRAEPIDVYPLLRPFAIGLCIMFFPTIVLGTINSVLSPVVKGTHQMLESQTFSMQLLREQKDKLELEAQRRNPENGYMVDNEEFDKELQRLGVTDATSSVGLYDVLDWFTLSHWIQKIFREILELLFEAAGLVVDTLRTFFLIVLSILGPIAFAISVWDGFQSTLTQWITRYVSVYMWLPVSDLFSSILARIQSLMIGRDIAELQSNSLFVPNGSMTMMILFMIIGIIGYFTIPSVAGWIIQAGGMGNYGKNVNSMASKGASAAGGAAGAAAGNISGRLLGK